jgi:hypothetical protein
MSGNLQLNTSIPNVVLMFRKSSSTCHRILYGFFNSSFVVSCFPLGLTVQFGGESKVDIVL